MQNRENLPELMLPVGNKDMFYAAVQNGADAVYLGVPHWNARGRTEDLSFDDVREMIRYARIRNVRTFLAMNILIFENELDSLPEFIENLTALKPDAIIIQDIGLSRLFQAVAPKQEIHASTQMTIASAEGIELAKRLGFKRAVLARELSIDEIRKIAARTSMELEVFVHGALCVSFSGQCLTSENFGGRSANRGQCAQSCRLPYRMYVDGKEKNLGGKSFLFSPRDLSAIDELDELKKIGIKAFKVEGRLKSPEYVAAVARAFREKLDTGFVSPKVYEPLEILFSRGLGPGWLRGTDQQTLVDGAFSNHHGQYLGKVESVEQGGVILSGRFSIEPGDGILFEDPGESNATGSRLYSYKEFRGKTLLEFDNKFNFSKVHAGMSVFRNDSPALEKELKKSYTDRELEKHIPIRISLSGKIGSPLCLILEDNTHKITASSKESLELAKTPRDMESHIKKELASLSGTAYKASEISLEIQSNAFLMDKTVRLLRKEATDALDNARLKTPEIDISAERGEALIAHAREKKVREESTNSKSTISVLVRTPEQIEGLKGQDIDRVVMDFDWGVNYERPLARIRELGFQAGIATLRVLKEGETAHLKKINELAPDFILIRNLGAITYFENSKIPLEGDYSLNISNSLSAEWFLAQGLRTLHPSLDLNAEGLKALIAAKGGIHFEVSVFEHLPAFYMEYCLYAATLTEAERFPNCKQICSKHHIDILDHKGARHTLLSDAECRNTLYLEKPQSALNLVPMLKELGVNHFRLEMLEESPIEVTSKIRLYAEALRGRLSLKTAAKLIGAEEKYGVSEGQLFNTLTWQDRKKG
ncbi:MAG: U32 family peptidase [Fibrobacteraceae bacterium]|nr:U32 family peptidase [Fibrobacteraceae bacterium]